VARELTVCGKAWQSVSLLVPREATEKATAQSRETAFGSGDNILALERPMLGVESVGRIGH
jgi:hypothetical protein